MTIINSAAMLSYDMHIHSALSPCGDMDMTPNNIVNMAALLGLDVIAVTDHNTIGNAEAAMLVGKRAGVRVIPGMEVETIEAVHVLTLYPDIQSAQSVAESVYNALPDIKNKPDIFGMQAYMDEWDNILGYEEKLLISSAQLDLAELFELVRAAGGVFVPAHVDRHSYSILSNLGFIPKELPVEWIEFSKMTDDIVSYVKNRPDLKDYKILRNSDAHYLQDISEPEHFLNISSVEELFKNLRNDGDLN